MIFFIVTVIELLGIFVVLKTTGGQKGI